MPRATPMPAQPPIPERTAMYCLPSGPVYVIGLPIMPDGHLKRHSSQPVSGEEAEGCWSLKPIEAGQIPVVFFADVVPNCGLRTGRPVVRSILDAQLGAF